MKNYKDRKHNKVGGWMYWNKKHSGLKIAPKPTMFLTRNSWRVETCNSHMFALSDAREFSFSQVLHLEREEKITDRLNFVNEVTKFHSTLSEGNLRELKHQRWRQLQKRHLKSVFAMISSRSVRLKTVSMFRKRKRKSLYCVFALH